MRRSGQRRGQPGGTRSFVFTVVLTATVAGALAACRPPEQQRVRGGGPGADLGNRRNAVETHLGSKIFHRTPCLTTLAKCTGPRQPSGRDRLAP